MNIEKDRPLGEFTSFRVGGPAEQLITLDSNKNFSEILNSDDFKDPLWVLGYGTNSLISDKGLSGTTVRFVGGEIEIEDDTLITDAGVWWDDLVKVSIENNLWGIELMSAVPGGVGAAAFINIACYGQTQSDTLEWVEYFDRDKMELQKINSGNLEWDYKSSIFQQNPNLVITRVAYKLSREKQTDLTYQSAIDIANELGLDPDNLNNRRKIVVETRRRAGSIFEYGQDHAKTVGSFFRNPLVTQEQADSLVDADETGKTKEQIEKMNKSHGGDSLRVSAAHVMLASGFNRGQEWGPVRLHPDHVLKIENTGDATAQQIFDVSQEIVKTCRDKTGITLEPEARFFGDFN